MHLCSERLTQPKSFKRSFLRQKVAKLFRGLRREKVALRGSPVQVLIRSDEADRSSWRPLRLCVRSFFKSIDDASDASFD
jgi:hypothetical protein